MFPENTEEFFKNITMFSKFIRMFMAHFTFRTSSGNRVV